MKIHFVALVLCCVLFPIASHAALGTPLGDTTLVHPLTGTAEREVDVAIDAHGDYVVVWEVGSATPEVRGQRFTSHGAPTGTQFVVDASIATYPEISSNPSGDTVVVWVHTAPEGAYIYARQYGADGSVGSVIQVDPSSSMFVSNPDVSMADDGSFVVVWVEDNAMVKGRRFDPNGTATGDAFQVNTLSNDVWIPAVSVSPLGEFVVAWSQQYRIVARKYDSAGSPVTGDFFLDSGNGKEKRGEPRVAMLPNGGFAAVWSDSYIYGTAVGGYLSIFDQQANPLVSEVQFNSSYNVRTPDIAADRQGRFVITWVYQQDAVIAENRLRYYDSGGVALTGVTSLSGTINPAYNSPIAVALDADGDMMAVWSPGSDELYMRRFQGDADVDLGVTIDGNPVSASPSENVTYNVTVNNLTPVTADVGVGSASGVVAIFSAFVGMGTMVSVSSADGACSSDDTAARCELMTIAADGSAQIQVTVQAPESDMVGGRASFYLHQTDSNTVNDEDSVLAEVTASSGETTASGGGGGGSLDWFACIVLIMLQVRRKLFTGP